MDVDEDMDDDAEQSAAQLCNPSTVRWSVEFIGELHLQDSKQTGCTVPDDVNLLVTHWHNFGKRKPHASNSGDVTGGNHNY